MMTRGCPGAIRASAEEIYEHAELLNDFPIEDVTIDGYGSDGAWYSLWELPFWKRVRRLTLKVDTERSYSVLGERHMRFITDCPHLSELTALHLHSMSNNRVLALLAQSRTLQKLCVLALHTSAIDDPDMEEFFASDNSKHLISLEWDYCDASLEPLTRWQAPHLQAFHFRGMDGIRPIALRYLSQVLTQSPWFSQLTDLSLEDIFCMHERDTADLLNDKKFPQNLRRFAVGPMSGNGVGLLAASPKLQHLHTLEIRGMYPYQDDVFSDASFASTLQKLVFHGGGLGHENFAGIGRLADLEELDLQQTNLSRDEDEETEMPVNFGELKKLQRLRVLNLQSTHIDDMDTDQIIDALPTGIRCIHLSFNDPDVADAAALSLSERYLPHLREVSLAGMPLSRRAAAALARSSLRDLRSFSVGHLDEADAVRLRNSGILRGPEALKISR